MKKTILVFLIACFFVTVGAETTLVRTFTDSSGNTIEERSIPGIPVNKRVPGPNVVLKRSSVIIPDVPAYDWSYGCAATTAAMLAGYYDRHGYSNIYTGPTNNGEAPLTNAAWGNGECPLSATHQGYDNLITGGHVNHFYVSYLSSGNDPFGTGDPTGTYSNCTADYMGTNQDWWNNVDGSTTIYNNNLNYQLSDYTNGETATPRKRDLMHGLKLFFQSRGYTVTSNFNQKIYGYDGVARGFSLADYRANIDAGIPVMIHISGHTMLGVGYDTASDSIYVRDTWDYNTHSMKWGGYYSGAQHYAVSVITLAPTSNITWTLPPASITLPPNSTSYTSFTVGNNGNATLDYSCSVPSLINTVLNESFENSTLPTGWSQEYTSGSTAWQVTAGGSNMIPSTPQSGARFAYMHATSGTQIVTKLITPRLDLSGSGDRAVSFWFAQAVNGSNQDQLKVYYRTSLTGTWNLLGTEISNTTAWKNNVWFLPEPNSTYYLAFEATSNNGYGVCLDNIKIVKPAVNPAWLYVNGYLFNTNSILAGQSNQTINLTFNTNGLSDGTYSTTINVASNSKLNPSIDIPVSLVVKTPISIITPTAGTYLAPYSSNEIKWNYQGTASTVTIKYTTNGSYYLNVATVPVVQGINTYSWFLSAIVPTTNTYRIKIIDGTTQAYTAISGVFSVAKPQIRIDTPAIDFGEVLCNTSTSKKFTITNPGLSPLTGYFLFGDSRFTITSSTREDTHGKDAGYIASGQTRDEFTPFTVPAGTSKEFTLTFNPTYVASFVGDIEFNQNGTVIGDVSIPKIHVTAQAVQLTKPKDVTVSRVSTTGDLLVTWSPSLGNPTGYKIYKCSNPNFGSDAVLFNTYSYLTRYIYIPAASLGNRIFIRVVAYKD